MSKTLRVIRRAKLLLISQYSQNKEAHASLFQHKKQTSLLCASTGVRLIFCTKQKAELFALLIILRKMGLEPTRCNHHKILSLARLPVPTLPLSAPRKKYNSIIGTECQH